MPDALRALRAGRPRVEEGWSAGLVRLTARGDLDLAVVSVGDGAQSPPGAPLLREPFVALLPARRPLARRKRLALRDLAGEPWLVAPEPGGREAVLAACPAAGFTPRIAGAAGWHAAGRLIAVGLGVALAPERTGARVAREPGVVARPLTDVPVRELRLVRAFRARRTPAEVDLEARLREAAGRGAGG